MAKTKNPIILLKQNATWNIASRRSMREGNMPGEDYIVGKHVYGSLYGIPREMAEDEEYLRDTVKEAAEAAGATIHSLHSWRIPGSKGGISVIALVLESHIAIHTWPEYDYATFDAYTCGEHTDPWRAWHVALEKLKPRHYTVNYADRSQKAFAPELILEDREV